MAELSCPCRPRYRGGTCKVMFANTLPGAWWEDGATRHNRSQRRQVVFLSHGSLAFGMRSRGVSHERVGNVVIKRDKLSRHARTFSSELSVPGLSRVVAFQARKTDM